MPAYTDETIMPFGKEKGKQMIDIPDWWFKSYWKNNDVWYRRQPANIYPAESYDGQRYNVMKYIEDNFEKSEL